KRVEEMGVKKIEFAGSISEVSDKITEKIGTLVITAHGIGPKIFEIAREKGIDVVDTTCPKVMKAQRLAKVFLDRGYRIIIIGEKKHKEVQGIFRWAKKRAEIVSNFGDIENLKLDTNKKIAVVSQTTQNKDFVDEMVIEIKKKYPRAEILDTVCLTTKNRQEEVAQIARDSEAVLVIGSKESSNSNRLWEIAKKINDKTYFIERLTDIKEEWLNGIRNIGITAGASSPRWVIQEVVEYLENYKK
ncbi:MAG: 4-hydroxy-3-methylbut-2-enyl diphosphate reductase, partial [Candidatus Moranbacteria bacterium]|nr:4-hydroxy-3-methylbut-2-enyl diphosphate reductase [Candidatus Moranbacteria bacterium]